MRTYVSTLFLLFLTWMIPVDNPLQAQLVKDLERQIQIPNIINLNSTETHLYVLSGSEGLVVFRAYSDSLQWLYSSTGMQQRGNILEGDIRFAYLYGNSRRLTVIEPTSVLGVYSSTILPDVPQSAKRVGNNLYIALGKSGLGRISLETPQSVDSGIEMLKKDQPILDLATDGTRTLFALQNGRSILIYNFPEEKINLTNEVELEQTLEKLFLVNNELMGSDSSGNIFLVDSDGQTEKVANVQNPVDKISSWKNRLIVRTKNGDLWIEDIQGNMSKWKQGDDSGNYFTVTEDDFWLSEYDKVFPIIEKNPSIDVENTGTQTTGRLALKQIDDVIIPFPRPLLLPIEFESPVNPRNVSLSYKATFNNAEIRGNTFYWQPSASQSGRHTVTITATSAEGQADSTRFMIDVRPFNAPPRFSPTRPITIPVGETFELKITAIDPDGMDKSLIRYLGVDLPNGAHINEKTGIFSWNPTIRQVGEHQFRIIATDQYGAAASQDYTIKVIEIADDSTDEDLFEQ